MKPSRNPPSAHMPKLKGKNMHNRLRLSSQLCIISSKISKKTITCQNHINTALHVAFPNYKSNMPYIFQHYKTTSSLSILLTIHSPLHNLFAFPSKTKHKSELDRIPS